MLASPGPPVRKTSTPRGAGASATATGSDSRPGALPNGSSRTLSVPQLNPVTPGQARTPVRPFAGPVPDGPPPRPPAAPLLPGPADPPLHPATAARRTAAAPSTAARLRPGRALAGARMLP